MHPDHPDFYPESDEVTHSLELRDRAFRVIPDFAMRNGICTKTSFILPLHTDISFLEVGYDHDQINVGLVETKMISVEKKPKYEGKSIHINEFHGTIKSCYIDPETGHISHFSEKTGVLDPDTLIFTVDETESPKPNPEEEPKTGVGRLLKAIHPPEPTEEDRIMGQLKGELKSFTQAKLNALLSCFVEIGAVDQ